MKTDFDGHAIYEETLPGEDDRLDLLAISSSFVGRLNQVRQILQEARNLTHELDNQLEPIAKDSMYALLVTDTNKKIRDLLNSLI